jgi:hypothetical protein
MFLLNSWISYVESSYDLSSDEKLDSRFESNLKLMHEIAEAPKNWSIECDEELADLLKDVVNTDAPGSIRNLIKSISVSTQRVRVKINAKSNF